MTPAFRQNPRPVGPILPMDPKIIPHRLAMPAEAFRKWKERNL